MKCTFRNLLLAGLLLLIGITAAQAEPPDPPDSVDPFAATLRAAAAIPKAKDRIYTIERVALAWARTDFCDEALQALQVEGYHVDAGAALEVASICVETVAGETAAKLLGFAQVRITQTVDPQQRALHLASLAGAYHYLERIEERDRAAQEAAATLPETCDPLATVLDRTALARQFIEVDMEAWAVHLLAGAARVALDLPGHPRIGGVWAPDDTPQEDLTEAIMVHLRDLGSDAAGFTPPPPLKGCPAAKKTAADFVAPEKVVALAAVSTVLRRLGDTDNAKPARILAVTLVRTIEDPAARARSVDEGAALLAKASPAEDAIFFLSAVAEDAPEAVRRAFGRMVFKGRLVTKNPVGLYVQTLMGLAEAPGPPQSYEDRFRIDLAQALLDLGAPEQAHEMATKVSAKGPWKPLYLKVLTALAPMDPGRAIISTGGMKGPWGSATLYRIAAALARSGQKEDVEEDMKEALELAAERFPKEIGANRGTVEALLARLDAAPLVDPSNKSVDDLDAAREQAITLPDDSARNKLLDDIARRYLRREDATRTGELARHMSGQLRDRLLWSIGMYHLDAGRSVVALETIQAMKSDGHRVRALAEVALRLAKAGLDLDAASMEELRKLVP